MSFNHITFNPILKQRKKKKRWPSGETSRIYICQGKRHRPDTNKFLFQSIDKSGTPRSALVTQTRGNNWQIRRIPIRLAASRSEQDPDPNTHALPTLTDSETWLIQATFSLIYLSYIKGTAFTAKACSRQCRILKNTTKRGPSPPSGRPCTTVRTSHKADEFALHRRFFRIKWSMSRPEPGAFLFFIAQ